MFQQCYRPYRKVTFCMTMVACSREAGNQQMGPGGLWFEFRVFVCGIDQRGCGQP